MSIRFRIILTLPSLFGGFLFLIVGWLYSIAGKMDLSFAFYALGLNFVGMFLAQIYQVSSESDIKKMMSSLKRIEKKLGESVFDYDFEDS